MKTDKRVNRLIAIVLIAMALVLFAVISSYAQTGYLIVIEHGNNTNVRKVKSIEQLEKVVKLYYPESKIDISEFMKGSVFFEVRRYNFRFYVEMKRITKKGIFRKLSKKEIRQIENKTNGSF